MAAAPRTATHARELALDDGCGSGDVDAAVVAKEALYHAVALAGDTVAELLATSGGDNDGNSYEGGGGGNDDTMMPIEKWYMAVLNPELRSTAAALTPLRRRLCLLTRAWAHLWPRRLYAWVVRTQRA